MKYDIHVFAVVRVKVTGVDASDAKTAATRAAALVDLNKLFNSKKQCPLAAWVAHTEFDDEITHFLVEPIGNSNRRAQAPVICFEPFGDGDGDGSKGLTEVPFDNVSTHVAVIVEGGNVQSVVTNRPCQVMILDHDHARKPGYDLNEEVEFHDSEVDPWLRCEKEFRVQFSKETPA